MNILAIETSCDETAAAIIKDGTHILSNVVVSQIDIFAAYGGVIPEIAARSHLEAMLPVIHQAFSEANCTWNDIDALAVTHTPGLLGSLLIGTLTARTLAILHNKPLYPVHHLKSHIYANWLNMERKSKTLSKHTAFDKALDFPLLALVVSGGHTQIIRMTAHNHFEIIGTTRDDAVGECFDKVAKILGLPYPGGPSIARIAAHGDPYKYHFPHPHLTHPARSGNNSATPSLDFSFSGLKTAVLRKIQSELDKPISFPSHELAPLLTEQQCADFAASFQQTAIDILLEKLHLALNQYPDTKSIVFAGGVAANEILRSKASSVFSRAAVPRTAHEPSETSEPRNDGCEREWRSEEKPTCFFPTSSLSGDNAAMVGAAAYYEIISGTKPTDPYHLDIMPRSPIQ